ncbi:hypothetical protein [Paraburkholderia phytofirmans]|uniref:hypothetical protein n=1 Tax=Paraburkholderia phytofirmans TaxID=261302 RepID=UPI001EE67168|nr:hypothetical protein [Paraburkholderia phytofirmans]
MTFARTPVVLASLLDALVVAFAEFDGADAVSLVVELASAQADISSAAVINVAPAQIGVYHQA